MHDARIHWTNMKIEKFLLVLFLLSNHCYAYDIFNEVYYPGRSGTFLEENNVAPLPDIHKSYRKRELNSKFTGHNNNTLYTSYETKRKNEFEENEADISWETVAIRSGKRVSTYVNVKRKPVRNSVHYKNIYSNFNKNSRYDNNAKRKRRNVFGMDDRAYIPITKKIGLQKPYIYSVKLSSGCTGMLISKRHVLSAAHCVHDQKDYVTSTKDLKVGFVTDNDELEWIGVKFVKVSKGWINGGHDQGPFFDYALLKLDKNHNRPYIRLSISEKNYHGTGERISFAGFDDDKPENTLWHRSCNVVEDDPTFLYHFCDAKPGSSGSGVYSWVYDNNLQDWKQELVGVFSGNRWRRYDYFFIVSRNFNVAVRLTSTKYAQICRWMGKTAKEVCKYKYDTIDKT